MFKVFAFFTFFAASAVFADPFLFDFKLLTLGNDHLASLSHTGHTDGDFKLRFVHLVPKFGYLDVFKNGFGSRGNGTVREHHFLDLKSEEHLVELVGLSDCKTWHATLLTVMAWGELVHKPFAWVKKVPVSLLPGVDGLVGFLFGKFTKHHFDALVKKGLPSHVLTHKLFDFFSATEVAVGRVSASEFV